MRRGRYSIAIRTQAILEAKARETTDELPSAAKKQRLEDPIKQEYSDDMESLSFDVFDDLLDIPGKTATEQNIKN